MIGKYERENEADLSKDIDCPFRRGLYVSDAFMYERETDLLADLILKKGLAN